jgi:hypothetical protein
MAYQESKFIQADEKGKITRSPKNALGIMQVLPDTARQYKFNLADLNNPEKNITAGLTYLKDLLDQSNGVQEIAAAKYNWGPGRKFFKTGEGDLPAETVDYVDQITKMGGFGGQPTGVQGPPPDKQFVDVPPVPKPGEAAPVEAPDGTGVEPTPVPGIPQAKIYSQEASNPEEDFETNRAIATATGGALGAAYGFGESRLNRAELRAAREEMARERVRSGALPGSSPTGGTSGERWSRNWAGRETPGSRSVPESASMYQRGKLQGKSKISQRINKLYPKLSPDDPDSIWERLSKQSDERAAIRRLAEEEANRPMNRARAALSYLADTRVGRIGDQTARAMFRYAPVVGYGMAGASLFKSASEMDEAIRRQEYIDGILAAAQMATTGASMIPLLAPAAVPADLGLGAYRMSRELGRQQ